MATGIGTTTDIIANLPAIFYDEGQYLWNYLAAQVQMSRRKKGRGPAFNWTVSNGGILVLNRPAGYIVNTATDVQNTDRVKVTLNRGIYSTSFGFTDDELATVESYLGTDAVADVVRDLWGSAYTEHLAGIMRQIEIDSLIGTGTTTGSSNGSPVSNVSNIVGFLNVLKTSGTYGGVTFGPGTNPGFQATVMDIGTLSSGNVSRAQIRTMFAGVKLSGFNPDYIMSSPLTATFLNGIGDNQIRYFNVADRELFNTTAQPLVNPALNNNVTQILGVPLIENSAWGTNSTTNPGANADGYVLFGAREKSLYDVLTYDKAQDAFLSEIREGLSKADNAPASPVGLPVRCWAQSKTAASKVVNMDISVGMGVLAPNRFGIMSNVTGFTANT